MLFCCAMFDVCCVICCVRLLWLALFVVIHVGIVLFCVGPSWLCCFEVCCVDSICLSCFVLVVGCDVCVCVCCVVCFVLVCVLCVL